MGFDPGSGDGARRLRGRFNPPHSFPVLYLCLTRRCVVAELTRQAERQGLNVEALLPRELVEVRADLDKLLGLTDAATLDALGIGQPDLVREDHQFTQEIGEAAHEHAFQVIRSPSATGVDNRRILIRPDVDGWWIWQVHGYASIDGIQGDADLDIMRGEEPRDPDR